MPELWRYNGQRLQINILHNGRYVESEDSYHFLGIPLKEIIPHYVEQSKIIGRNAAMKAFRIWLREQLNR